MPPPGSKAEIIIINAVECEPYLTSDHSLMMEKGEQILVGVTLLMKAVNVNKAVIGIENNKPDAIAHLTKLAAAYPGIEIMPLKVQYPQGGEKQLIDAVIRRQVKSGALPISAGAVVQNVGTAYAVYEAVQKNKPLFERVVTVTGKAVANPSNFLVRMGTPINTLIEAAGGIPENTGKIIGGGPMMGKALVSARSSGNQRQFRRIAPDQGRICPQTDAGLYPLRQVRERLPDGIEPSLPHEVHRLQRLGKSRGQLYSGLYRMRFL